MESNRRRYQRLSGKFKIQIDLPDEHKAPAVFDIGEIDNISAAGILMRYAKPIDIGTIVQVTFLGPNSFDIFKVDTRVLRVNPKPDKTYEIAVEYVDLSPEDEQRLDYFITYDQ